MQILGDQALKSINLSRPILSQNSYLYFSCSRETTYRPNGADVQFCL